MKPLGTSAIECDGGPNCMAAEHLHGCFAERRMGSIDRAGRLQARVDLLEDLISDVVDADTGGFAQLPQDLRERLVEAHNVGERVARGA